MHFLYFDCIGGASGDMILGALLDGLVPMDHLQGELDKLNLSGYTLRQRRLFKHHIDCNKLDVLVEEDKDHRHLSEIVRLIEESALSPFVKKESRAVFERLGAQEARAHRIPLEKVHFHEVGAIDAIVDIVGTCIAIDYLAPERIYASPLPLSEGTVKAAHGVLPVPAPATLGLLEDYPVYKVNISGELVTPTGAALISHFSRGTLPETLTFRIRQHGLGAGDKDFNERPNYLRVWRAESTDKDGSGEVYQILCNVDDMNPELYPHVTERLLHGGALDVTLTPLIMKQGRPGSQLTVLCRPADLESLSAEILKQTSTIGLRYHKLQRTVARREIRTFDTPYGPVRGKVIGEASERVTPEYEDCRAIALEKNRGIDQVYHELYAWLNRGESSPRP